MDTPKIERNNKGQFLVGDKWSGNAAGRPKGSRNKLAESFTDALYRDFIEHGEGAIEAMRATDPSGYVRVIAGILPKDLRIEKNTLDDLSDDQLGRIIDAIREADASTIGAGSAGEAPSAARTH